jgi:Spy/CpxP family protein refolding chaperone
MKSRKTLAIALLAVLILPSLALAAARPNPGPGPSASPDEILRNPRLLSRYLKLDAAQVAQLRTFNAELTSSLQTIRTARKPLQENLEALLAATPKDPCAIGNATVALDDNGDLARAAVETFDDKFSAILTPEQLTRYEALKAAARLLAGRGDGEADS